ncbi:MAG TPA: hypothetical protein VHY78_08320 [Stellaceae bacterium]|nr:hypothetical protein [Stellaceae bacterium]
MLLKDRFGCAGGLRAGLAFAYLHAALAEAGAGGSPASPDCRA